MQYIHGIALVAAFILLWLIGAYVFTWMVYRFTALFPYMGKRHRHARWDELNRTNRRT